MGDLKLPILFMMSHIVCAENVTMSPSPVHGVNESASVKLYNQLISGLPSPDIRPQRNAYNELMMVTVNAVFYQILDVDDVGQTVTVMIFMLYVWKNDFVTWDPKDYGGITNISVNPASVWTPSITVDNRVEHLNAPETHESYVLITHDGTMIWDTSSSFTVGCSLNMLDFPKDSHKCSMALLFLKQSKLARMVHFSEESDIKRDYITPRNSTSFELTSLSSSAIDVGVFIIEFGMKRVPGLITATIINPVIAVATIMPVSLLLPPDSEAKLDIQITSVLAFSVYMIIVVDLIPPYLPNHTPKIVNAMMLALILDIATVVVTILVLRMVNCNSQMPNSTLYRVVVVIGQFLLITHPDPLCQKVKTRDTNSLSDKEGEEAGSADVHSNVTSVDISFLVDFVKSKQEDDLIRSQWYHIGAVADRIMMIVSICIVAFIIGNYLVQF